MSHFPIKTFYEDGVFELEQSTTPSNPPANSNKLFFNTSGELSQLDSSGNETLVGGSTPVNANAVVDGDFQSNQQATLTLDGGTTAATTATYFIDMTKTNFQGVTATIEYKSTAQPSDLAGSNSMRMAATSSATGALGLWHVVEEFKRYAGKQVTFSAYVKSNTTNARLVIYDGVSVQTLATGHTGGGAWERLTFTATINASPTQLNLYSQVWGNGADVAITSGDYIEVTGMKLEYGDTATTFIPDSNQENISRVHRYYEVVERLTWGGFAEASRTYRHTGVFKQRKAKIPTMTLTRVSGNISTNNPVQDTVNVDMIAVYFVTTAASGSGYYLWKYTADARA